MTLSNSIDFDSTAQEIIFDAYSKINVYGANESVSTEDGALAMRILNRMMKVWQSQGLHLWKKQTATIFLQKGQSTYVLKEAGSHAATKFVGTTLSSDEAIGQTIISVTSSSSMTVGDYVGIENDNNQLQWSTISNIPDSASIVINDALTVAASSGLRVYTYTDRLKVPFNVLSAIRRSKDTIDTPMNYLSWEEYFQLPNKGSLSTPVSYNYDRQEKYAVIRIWPVPNNVNYLMQLSIIKKIEDIDSVSNTTDFPQEWLQALVDNLAVKLAHHFGKASAGNYQILASEAQASLLQAASFDNEPGSIYLEPDFEGGGGF